MNSDPLSKAKEALAVSGICILAAGEQFVRYAEHVNAELTADPGAATRLSALFRVSAEHQAAREAAFDRFMRAALPGWRPGRPHTPAAL
jgi:hypothetical protein